MTHAATLDTTATGRLRALVHTVLRVGTALLFMQHGAQKLLGWFADPERPWTGPPAMLSLLWFAGVLELVGGALVALGLLTRPVAFLLAGQMAVAYLMAHAPRAPWPVLNGGEHTLLFCVVFLYLAVAGGGPYSVDAFLYRRHGAR